MAVVVLLGVRRTHLHAFPWFVAALLGVALLTVAVFALTARGDAEG